MQSVSNNIKNINAWANGATGLLNPNVVTNLSSAINGLNLQQAKLVLSTKNLTQEQIHQVLVQAGLIASEEQIQAELVQSALAQSSVSAENQKAILTELGLMDAKTNEMFVSKACTKEELLNMLAVKGITGTNADAIISTLVLAGANGTATVSFKLLTASIWANIKALVKWLATNPVGWCVMAVTAIFGVVKAFDALTVSFDEAVEKTKSSKEELDKLTSKINDLNNELKTTKDRIDELLEKANSGTISLLEEEELNNLREQNDELQREIALKEKLAEMDAKEVAENAANSITYKTDDDHWDDEYNATDRIDKLQKYVDSANFYQEKIAEVNQQILDIEESATDSNYKNSSTYKNLIKQQEKYQDELKEAEEQMSSTYKALSVEDDGLYYNGKVIEGYEDLAERLDTVYMAVELYLNDGSIEDTIKEYVEIIKNKLMESGLSEEISNAVTEGFSEKELSSIMNAGSIDWSVCLGLDDATAVIENIKQQLTSVGNVNTTTPSLSINEMVDQLNTRLKPAFDSLGSAYQDIFTTDGFDIDAVDIPMLEDLRSALEDLNEAEDLDINIDMGAFDDFSRILTDTTTTEKQAQQAFDDLATSLFYATSATEGMSEETIKLVEQLLESLGVTNAEEVAIYALKDAKAQAILATYDLADVTRDEADAARDSFAALLDEGEAANLTRQEIYNLTAAEIAFGQNTLSTEQKIEQLHNLATAYGDTASAALATAIANDLASGHTDVDSAINDLMAKINNGVQKVNLDFTSKPKSSKSKKKEKDTTETFDWIEQAIENIEKEVKNLDDVVNSAYSTFSQKNEALAQEIEKVNEDIELQQQTYEKYMQKAESIALNDDYKVLVRDGAINIENISDEKLKTAISDYQKWYDKAISVSDAISDLKVQLKDLHVTGYELNSDRFKELLDSEAITQKQYIEEMTKLYEKFYENQTEYAVQAHEAKLALLDEEKSYLNSVANAAASLLDKEIDKIQDNAKEQEKIYQKQIDILNEKKKPLEDELDTLEDKAKKEDLILGLQEKQYNLKKLENQRDKLVYYMPDTIVI